MLIAGLGCFGAALGVNQADVSALIGRRITQAGGSLSPEAVEILRSAKAVGLLLLAGLGLTGLGAATFFKRSAVARAGEFLATRPFGTTVLAANLLMILWYFPTLTGGFFRFDDFDLLARAQTGSFWSTLWQPHGDHVLPLTRVLAWLGFGLFGVTAWPYNAWLWLCMAGVLSGGLLVLEEFRTSRAAQWLFAVLLIFWSPWAEIMTGYYILSTYLLIASLGLACIWFLQRWQRTGNLRYAAGASTAPLLALLVDVSGGYVIGLAGVWLGLELFASGDRGHWFRRNRPLLLGLGVAAILGAGCLIFAYRVVNPGVFLGMAGQTERTLGSVARDLLYLLGSGTLLSMVTPFVYARLPSGLLAGLTAAAGLAFLLFLRFAWRVSDPMRRLTLAAMVLMVVGTGLMVVLGRPPSDTWVVRWAAKHLCPAYLWLCLLLATGWDVLRSKQAADRRAPFAELTVIGLAGFVALQTSFGALGLLVSFPPFGYPAELRDAGIRRAAVATLRNDLESLQSRLGPGAVVPTIDGPALKAACPSLFRYNLSHYRPFLGEAANGLVLVRNTAMQSWHTPSVRTVPDLRAAVSPEFVRLLGQDRRLQELYCAEVPLEAQAATENFPEDGFLTVESDGRNEIMIRADTWDPLVQPRLLIAPAGAQAVPPSEITVVFRSGLLQRDWRGAVQSEEQTAAMLVVDLRQNCAFALSDQVADLRVVIATPGRYRFRLAPADR